MFGGKDRNGYPRPFLQIPLRIASYSEWKFGGKDRIRTCERVTPLHAFQACALNHSATFPSDIFYFNIFIGKGQRDFRCAVCVERSYKYELILDDIFQATF